MLGPLKNKGTCFFKNSTTAVSFHYFYTFINAKSSHKELRGINGKVTVHQPAKVMNNISCVVFAQSEERSTPCHMEMCCFSFCAANVRISSKIEHNSYCAVFPLNAPAAMFDQKAHMLSQISVVIGQKPHKCR